MGTLSDLNGNYKNFFDDGSQQKDKGSENRFASRWGWWGLIDNLTNSRIDKWDEVLNWEVIKALNVCCYFKDKQKMEAQMQREAMQKMKRR